MTALRPIQVQKRSVLLDALRGFAIWGIFLVNFRGPVGNGQPAENLFSARMLDLLVSHSFYPLFAFLSSDSVSHFN